MVGKALLLVTAILYTSGEPSELCQVEPPRIDSQRQVLDEIALAHKSITLVGFPIDPQIKILLKAKHSQGVSVESVKMPHQSLMIIDDSVIIYAANNTILKQCPGVIKTMEKRIHSLHSDK